MIEYFSLGYRTEIYDFFCMVLLDLMSIRGMDKWVTPLGRVFKIHDFFGIVLIKNDIVNS